MWWTEWIADAEPYAYNVLGLMPWDFFRLTPREFRLLVEGHAKRKRKDLEREAAWVCVIANSGGRLKKTLRPTDLIGMSLEDIAKLTAERDAKRRRVDAEKKRAAEAKELKA